MKLVVRTVAYGLTYVVLTDPGSAWNWLVGALAGCMVAWSGLSWRRPDHQAGHLGRLLWLPWFVAGSGWHMIRGSWQTLLVAVGRRTWRNVGLVTCRGIAETDRGLAVLALVNSATPGSVAAVVDRETNTLTLSNLDASDPDGERDRIARFYNRYQRRTVP